MDGQQLKPFYDNREISLIDLFNILWQQKILILTVTLVCFLLSTMYLAITKPVYEAKAYLVAPTLGDIAALNAGRSNLKNSPLTPLNVDDVYQVFSDALISKSVQYDFFQNIYLPSLSKKKRNNVSKNKLFAAYANNITIKEDTKTKPVKYTIIARAENARKVHDWVKQYVDLANKKAISLMIQTVTIQNKELALQLQHQIDQKKQEVKSERLDRLAQLEEALKIAQATGVTNPIVMSDSKLDSVSMMYTRGSKALESEIKALNMRKNDDPFAHNLRKLESDYAFYEKLVIPTASIKMFRLDGGINMPDSSIAPKYKLILMLGLLGGIIIGCFVALLRGEFLKRI